MNEYNAEVYRRATEVVDGLIGELPRASALTIDDPSNRERFAALRLVRQALQHWAAAQPVVDQLTQLCPCSSDPDGDGPQQDCPVHGDGESFVALCRWRDVVVAAGHAVNDTVADGPGLVVVQRTPWERLRDLLNAGPWAGPDTAIGPPTLDNVVTGVAGPNSRRAAGGGSAR